ncbi:MAG: MerR family transcriptional regulator [bacterium]|nr:MerR family transcriptional regulator [bacterium]
MLINEAAKLSDLTKKAVEYYTEQKLIIPNILENGYRDYTKQDTKTLKQISLYRKLGLSISEIKIVLSNPTELKSILYNKTLELEQEKIKQDILEKIVNGESLEKLEQEINNINSKTIIIKKLMDLFPSYYGKIISLNFSRYLTGRIETEEQMEAFKEIIDFFDNVPDIEIPEDLQKYLDNYIEEYSSEEGQEKINSIIQTKDNNIKNIDEFVRKNKEVLNQYNEYKKTEEFKNSPANRLKELMKQVCSTNGYYEKFIPAMRKLSPLYNEYYEQLMKAKEQFIKNYPEYTE